MAKKIHLTLLFIIATLVGFSQIVINEISASNKTYPDPQYGAFSDWIELYNTENQAFDLSGYYITDNASNKNKWKIPASTIIAANGFIVVWADGLNKGLHTNFNLSIDGEFIGIVSPSKEIIDSITFGIQKTDVSFGRINDGALFWGYFNTPTPNKTNNSSSATVKTVKPLFSLASGVYTGTQTITISGDPLSTIYYTTDGSTPTKNSTIYSEAISLTTTTVLKAIAIKKNEDESELTSGTYFIDEHAFNLPILSISTDPNWLFNADTGIYELGPNADTADPHYGANYWLDKEIPMTFQYYSPTGKELVNVEGGAKIYGGWSRANELKSMQFKAKSKYGASYFHYQFFKDKNITEFKNIATRNSGNDWGNTMFRDAFMQTLTKKFMKIDYQETQHVAFFINGKYSGIEILTEKINENYIASNYNIDPDNVDLLDAGPTVLNGNDASWKSFETYYTNKDLSIESNYNTIKTMMDIDEYIDYMIAELYYDNTDWPGNNMKYWRERKTGAKWRWIMYDTDFGFGIWGSNPCDDPITFITEANGPSWPNPPRATMLFRKLLQNQTFKTNFIQRFAYHMSTSFEPTRVNGIIDSIKTSIQNEMKYHIDRWGKPGSIAEWENNVTEMKNFNTKRGDCVKIHIQDYFSLSGMASIIVKNDTSKGSVFVSGKNIDTLHQGNYFKDITLPVSAIARDGYKFKYWNKSEYTSSTSTKTKTLIAKNSSWNYLDNGTDQGTSWILSTFDDSRWKTGNGIFGYSENKITTTINFGSEASNKYLTTYFRKKCNINTINNTIFTLNLMRGDGAVVYINGVEAARSNMPNGNITYQTTAYGASEADEASYLSISIPASAFINGENTIAVEVHQTSITSSDLSFDMELVATTTSSEQSITTNSQETPSNLNLLLQNNIILEPVYEKDIVNIPEATESEFFVYPVPLTDILHVSAPGDLKRVTIYTIEGVTILNTGESILNVSNLVAGTYIVEIKSDKGIKRILTVK